MNNWLTNELRQKIRKVFEPKYKRKLTKNEVEEKPTYEDLANGTPKLAPIFVLKGEYMSYEGQSVTHRVWNWNQIFSEFGLLYSSLIKPQNSCSTYSL